ncbi:hypothetical protein CDV31_005890 [Fusarium ambrosium]|uniref:Uncharacterized protein n=1 Tax=Fusarium ambrosium TaxID=131363 RepID=A0A428UGR6_9HYPO|nr:hypothetical protein CDV31_005890 [Fusarium ambrosium]
MKVARPEQMVNISMAEDPKLRTGVRADRSPGRPDSTCVSLSSPRFPIWEGQCCYVMIVDLCVRLSWLPGQLITKCRHTWRPDFADLVPGLVHWAWARNEIFVLFREAAAALLSLVIGFFFPLHDQLERNAKNSRPAQSQGLRNNFTEARAAESPERD